MPPAPLWLEDIGGLTKLTPHEAREARTLNFVLEAWPVTCSALIILLRPEGAQPGENDRRGRAARWRGRK